MLLRNKLFNKPFCDKLHFFGFGLVILLISLKYPIFYLFLLIYLVFLFKKTHLFKPFCLLCLLLVGSYTWQDHLSKELEPITITEEFEVLEADQNNLLIKGSVKLLCYNNSKVVPGDIILATVKVLKFQEKSYVGDFDSKAYYKAKGVYNRGSIISYQIIGHRTTLKNIRYNLIRLSEERFGKSTALYVNALVFGQASFEANLKEAYSTLYISHILVISGMHLMLLYSFIVRLLQKFFKIEGSFVSTILLGLYVAFLGFPISALRAYLIILMNFLNRFGKQKYTNLDIFSLSFIIMVILNPYNAYQTGFILSYLVSFVLLFKDEFILTKSYLKQNFLTSLLCFITTLPIIINSFNRISLLGIFLAFLFSIFFTKIIFPITIVSIIIPNDLFESFFTIINESLITINENMLVINVGDMNIYLIVIYYFLLILFLISIVKKSKRLLSGILFSCLIIIILTIRFLNPFYRITFIDVGQGDSILIEMPYEKGNVLIDSFGPNLDYLKSIGVNRIDYLVLTHFDNDHIGSSEKILKNIEVKKIIYSEFEDVNKIKDLNAIKEAYRGGMQFQIGEITFKILGPLNKFKDSNSNSLVLQFKIGNYTFILTGDMTIEEENDLIAIYGTSLNSDVLKVGHHGSNTSSSREFLDYVTPSISIISVASNNQYGLPSLEVVNRLKSYGLVYMTKDQGNIMLKIRDNLEVIPYRS